MAESHLQSPLITASQFFEIWLHFDADGDYLPLFNCLKNLVYGLSHPFPFLEPPDPIMPYFFSSLLPPFPKSYLSGWLLAINFKVYMFVSMLSQNLKFFFLQEWH